MENCAEKTSLFSWEKPRSICQQVGVSGTDDIFPTSGCKNWMPPFLYSGSLQIPHSYCVRKVLWSPMVVCLPTKPYGRRPGLEWRYYKPRYWLEAGFLCIITHDLQKQFRNKQNTVRILMSNAHRHKALIITKTGNIKRKHA